MAHHGAGRQPARALLAGRGDRRPSVGALVALPAAAPVRHLPGAGHRRVRGVPRPVGLHPADVRPRPVDDQALRPRRASPSTGCDVPGVGTDDRAACWSCSSVVVRRCSTWWWWRSGAAAFGERLLAMKDSPAACATLGIEPDRGQAGRVRLSAAMAGVGGALYAGTLGSVSPPTFDFFESLPLLLLAVVGGIGTRGGRALRRRRPRRPRRSSPSAVPWFDERHSACCPAPWASPSGRNPERRRRRPARAAARRSGAGPSLSSASSPSRPSSSASGCSDGAVAGLVAPRRWRSRAPARSAPRRLSADPSARRGAPTGVDGARRRPTCRSSGPASTGRSPRRGRRARP